MPETVRATAKHSCARRLYSSARSLVTARPPPTSRPTKRNALGDISFQRVPAARFTAGRLRLLSRCRSTRFRSGTIAARS